jgi:hypothetical protein
MLTDATEAGHTTVMAADPDRPPGCSLADREYRPQVELW